MPSGPSWGWIISLNVCRQGPNQGLIAEQRLSSRPRIIRMPQLTYSKHLGKRLLLRGIERELPGRIYLKAQERFFDAETGHYIATMTVPLYNKSREVMIAYTFDQASVTLLTIHPLKPGQKSNHLATGRWRKIP